MNETIGDLKEVFELGTGCIDFVKNIINFCKDIKNKKNYSSVDGEKIGSSGDYVKIGSSGDKAKIGSSGYYAKIGSSGYYAKIGSSGYYAQIGSSGDYAQIGSSGADTQIGSSGDYVKIGSSGDKAKIGSSGYYAKIGSSGYYAQIGSSGNYVKIGSSGDYVVISAIGYYGVVSAKKGSWITLAEYKNKKPVCVKTGFVDGKNIKEDVYYCLCDGKFCEYIEADGIKSAIILKRKNVYKIKIFGENKISYLIKHNNIWSHGKTIKDAKESLIYKLSDRDTSKYSSYTMDTVLTKKEAIEMYMSITGACAYGTKNFVDTHKIKNKLSVDEVIKITDGKYGNKKLKEFFYKNN